MNSKFTWKELSSLSKPENAHVAYNGKVYDVSSFVSSHPGGIDQIMLGAGHDITPLFHCYHQPKTIKILEKYYVGDMIDNEMPVYAVNNSQFYATLKKRVKEKFQSLGIDPKFDLTMFLRYFFFCTVTFLIWCGVLFSADSLVMGCFFAFFWSMSTTMIFYTLGHDSSHYCITHNPTVWRIARITAQCFTGLSIYCWTYQHTYAHHSFTNIDGADPDVTTPSFIWRIKRRQPWFKHLIIQFFYLPLLYSFSFLVIGLQQDFYDMKMHQLQKGTVRMNPPSAFQWREFYFVKIFHNVMKFVVPLFFMSFSSMLLYNVVFILVLGFWAGLISMGNHVTTDVSWIEVDENRVIQEKSWAEVQVLSTKDYDTDSWLCTLLTGALNHQVAHHLFPDVLQTYYPLITPIVRETCAEFGITYHCETNIFRALLGHLKYLFKMGQDPSHGKTQ